ncbi:MAG: sigma-54 dependent transcriptional regulator [Candidatus Sumerlaeota bacterium]|nr:sigma-54 dependent transcriptional regulator [Candidatus Sumerlaeota bacterium]
MKTPRPKSSSPTPARVLVVDDDAAQRSLLGGFLGGQGFHVVCASSGAEALDVLGREPIDAMVSDVRMPGMTGLEMLAELRQRRPGLPVLLVTAYPHIHDAVKAMRDGAVNYLEKPIDLDELLSSVRLAVGIKEAAPASKADTPPMPLGIVAQSSAMREILSELALVAPSDSRLLITGESGTGKEVIADLTHAWSPRASGPLVKVNCAAIPETLLESELFGHEKGAFTGATDRRIGRFEEARGGTVFLDEIAEMSPALQARLLRVAQDGSFQRVGSNAEVRSDARILAATNRNLEAEVAAGRFREDLFFRLNVFEIYVPPLRERAADILPLAYHFLDRFTTGRARLSAAAAALLELYPWPGNVRELRNAIERAALISRGELILTEHLPRRIQRAGDESGVAVDADSPTRRMEEVERSLILNTLREADGNRSEAARRLGISRRALHYKLRRYAEQGYAIDAD